MKTPSLALASLALAALAAPALAHIAFETPEVAAGAATTAVLRLPHGCDGAATTEIRIEIPEGVIDVRPMPKPGWALQTVIGPYATPATLHGEAVTEGVRQVIWSGGSLPDSWYDEFTFRARLPEGESGSAIPVTVVQVCGATVVRWDQVATDGQPAHDLEFPAPAWTLAEPVHTH